MSAPRYQNQPRYYQPPRSQYRPPPSALDEPALGCVAPIVLILCGIWIAPLVVGVALLVTAGIAVVTGVGYTAGGMKIFFQAMWWVYRTPPRWTLPPPAKPPRQDSAGDPALLGYFGGHAQSDHSYLLQVCRGRVDHLLQREHTRIKNALDPTGVVGTLAAWAFVAGAYCGLFLACLGAGAFLGLCVAVHALTVWAFRGGVWTGRHALRAVDRAAMLVRGVRAMNCPFCYDRIPYPAYRCHSCDRIHRDIRPGLHGVLRRVCLCGASLPTLLLLGSAKRLAAVCPHCDRPLEHRPGEAREFVLPLFGAAGAGKTRLMVGLHSVLEHAARTSLAQLEHADSQTHDRLRAGTSMLTPERQMNPTPPGRDPRGMLLRFSARRRTLLVQVYDAAGERFDRTETTQSLTYLGKAYTFVLAVDPLAVDSLWKGLTDTERRRLATFRSANSNEELSYQQTYQQIEHQLAVGGRDLRNARIAVALTRGDLLKGTSVAPEDGQSAADWARERLGLGNLLTSIDNNFGDWEVFHTSAFVGADRVPDASLVTLVEWVLAKESREFCSAVRACSAPASAAGC